MFLEQAVGVRREDFGPFVAVVTGRVAAVENVRKAFDEPIVVGSRNDGDLASNRGEQRFGTFPRCMRFGIVFGVQQHVEQCHLELAHRRQAAFEVLGCEHAVVERAGQRRARIDVRGHRLEHVPFPAEIFHELRGQLDGVPFDALDSRNERNVDLRQQLMQAVAEFVEQRDHFVMRECRRLGAGRWRQVARHVSDGMLNGAVEPPPIDRIVHPRAALLAGPRVEIEIELADELPVSVVHVEEANARMPDRRARRLNRHRVDRFDDAEQSLQHLILGKIRPHLLLGERIPRRFEFFGGIGEIPRCDVVDSDFVAREHGELRVIALGVRLRAPAEIAQERQHFVRRLRHLRHQRYFGEIAIA